MCARGCPVCRPVVVMSMTWSVARALAASLFMAQGPSLVVTAVQATALRVGDNSGDDAKLPAHRTAPRVTSAHSESR